MRAEAPEGACWDNAKQSSGAGGCFAFLGGRSARKIHNLTGQHALHANPTHNTETVIVFNGEKITNSGGACISNTIKCDEDSTVNNTCNSSPRIAR